MSVHLDGRGARDCGLLSNAVGSVGASRVVMVYMSVVWQCQTGTESACAPSPQLLTLCTAERRPVRHQLLSMASLTVREAGQSLTCTEAQLHRLHAVTHYVHSSVQPNALPICQHIIFSETQNKLVTTTGVKLVRA